jgi:hypothetical protein
MMVVTTTCRVCQQIDIRIEMTGSGRLFAWCPRCERRIHDPKPDDFSRQQTLKQFYPTYTTHQSASIPETNPPRLRQTNLEMYFDKK